MTAATLALATLAALCLSSCGPSHPVPSGVVLEAKRPSIGDLQPNASGWVSACCFLTAMGNLRINNLLDVDRDKGPNDVFIWRDSAGDLHGRVLHGRVRIDHHNQYSIPPLFSDPIKLTFVDSENELAILLTRSEQK